MQPAPASQLLRASFANFVWLTQAELDEVLEGVAFYHGYVPTAGNLNMPGDISNALQAALGAKGVSATIIHTTVPANHLHPYPAIEFRVSDPEVTLESAQVFDVPPTLVAKTLKAQDAVIRLPYNEGDAGTTIADVLLGPARDAGYIGARLTHIDRKRRATANGVRIAYTARMEAGPLYTVRHIYWTPTPVYSADQFAKDTPLRIGQPPVAGAAERTQDIIASAYHAQGYLEAVVTSDTKLTAATGAIDYYFSVTAGPQYHLRSLTVNGLPDAARKDFESAWTMRAGDVYNEAYMLSFLANHPQLRSLEGYTFDYTRAAAPDSHDVDLTLNFKPYK